MLRAKQILRRFLRSAAEEAIGAHIREITEGGATAINVADLLARSNEDRHFTKLRDYGFQVFSQYGEDGVIQHLVRNVDVPNDRFVEIGVEDYSESNTRFLLTKDHWKGLIIDGDAAASDFLRQTFLGHKRSVRFKQSFVTAENVEELLKNEPDEIGLLSIDIDGMDYWVWKAIERVRPAIVAIEYQATFGPTDRIVVPYRKDFVRSSYHASRLCYGASLAALEDLGRSKGYSLVGTSDGPNAFFVSDERLGGLHAVSAAEAYEVPCYREVVLPDVASGEDELRAIRQIIADCHVLDLTGNEIRPLRTFENLFDK